MFDITQEEDYRELTLEEQYLVNGGDHIENSIEAQAGASVGDTLTREDGTTWTLTQGDINWAREQIGADGSGGNSGTSSGTPDYGPSGNPGNGSDNSSNNNNPFANSNTPWGADEQMEAARLAKEKGKDIGILPKVLPNGDLKEKESDVTKFLNEIGKNPDNYSIEAYERKAIFDYPWKKGGSDSLLIHSLYVITNKTTRQVSTLSFNGTEFKTQSEGAWALNTETDVKGLIDLKCGYNSYSMTKLYNGYTIDSERTAANIINSINSSTSYYFRDHVKNQNNMENCNTALYNTVFFDFMK